MEGWIRGSHDETSSKIYLEKLYSKQLHQQGFKRAMSPVFLFIGTTAFLRYFRAPV
jgi:hypothetical protein